MANLIAKYRQSSSCKSLANDLRHLVAFVDMKDSGDSYTTTGFNASTGPQPSPENPLGNPKYPGFTASNGPNWVDYLTVKYNSSVIETYNLAYGGATVDSGLAKPYLPTVLSFQQQVQQEFLPLYAGQHAVATWNPATTLFACWFGINDVGNTYSTNDPANYTDVYAAILEQYSIQVNDLFAAGAQDFLFINVPPVQRSPLTTAQGPNASTVEAEAIAIFNAGFFNISNALEHTASSSNARISVNMFDAYSLFNTVLDNPRTYPQTSGFINTTDYCPAYENGTAALTEFDPSCSAPLDAYFWLNSLHPTFPMHDLLASKIADMLGWSSS